MVLYLTLGIFNGIEMEHFIVILCAKVGLFPILAIEVFNTIDVFHGITLYFICIGLPDLEVEVSRGHLVIETFL